MEKKKSEKAGTLLRLNEKTLSLLFDYQRFENDPRLETLINEMESEYSTEISDDDLSQVSAAGEAQLIKGRKGTEGDAI